MMHTGSAHVCTLSSVGSHNQMGPEFDISLTSMIVYVSRQLDVAEHYSFEIVLMPVHSAGTLSTS